ncbi:MAG: ABC transporter ATP-binding protein [Planctomycetota bacterium]|jgi:ABC-type lipoprotein export system ATPase subunit
MIRISQLEFRYRQGEFVLRVPELSVERGSAVAIIGPSGSGKTTLLHLMAGIAVPTSGRVSVDGTELCGLSGTSRRDLRIRTIGLVFQEFELLEYLTVLDNILLPYRISPALTLDRQVRQRAVMLAGRVGIGDKVGRLARRLSHGERQRAAICRAVLPEPKILLADEPTGNLDPSNKDRVLDIFFEYARETETTLIAVTHDRDILDRFDRVIDFKLFGGDAAAGGDDGGGAS